MAIFANAINDMNTVRSWEMVEGTTEAQLVENAMCEIAHEGYEAVEYVIRDEDNNDTILTVFADGTTEVEHQDC